MWRKGNVNTEEEVCTDKYSRTSERAVSKKRKESYRYEERRKRRNGDGLQANVEIKRSCYMFPSISVGDSIISYVEIKRSCCMFPSVRVGDGIISYYYIIILISLIWLS